MNVSCRTGLELNLAPQYLGDLLGIQLKLGFGALLRALTPIQLNLICGSTAFGLFKLIEVKPKLKDLLQNQLNLKARSPNNLA